MSEATKMIMSSAGSARNPTIISGRERYEAPGRGEQPDECDRVGDAREGQPGAHRGNDAGGYHHRAEGDVGSEAKELRGIRGNHGVLVKELANAAVREPDAGCAAVLQPRAALI